MLDDMLLPIKFMKMMLKKLRIKEENAEFLIANDYRAKSLIIIGNQIDH